MANNDHPATRQLRVHRVAAGSALKLNPGTEVLVAPNPSDRNGPSSFPPCILGEDSPHHPPDSSYAASPRIAVENLGYWIDDDPPADANYTIPTSTVEGLDRTQAVVPTGLPVIDGDKSAAYPAQGNLISSINHFIVTAAPDYFGAYESLLLRRFETFNETLFGGMIPALHIKIGACSSPRSTMGHYQYIGDHGVIGEITINKGLFSAKRKDIIDTPKTHAGFVCFIEDALLHEMVHAYCHLVLSNAEVSYHGHGPVFASECNNIGAIINVSEVRTRWDSQGKAKGIPLCNQWPFVARDLDHYQGAWKPCRGKPAPPDNDEDSNPDESLGNVLDLLDGPGAPAAALANLLKFASTVGSGRTGWQRIAYAVALIGRQHMSPDYMPRFPRAEYMAEVVKDDAFAPNPLSTPEE